LVSTFAWPVAFARQQVKIAAVNKLCFIDSPF
jgi:hypothetical protein